VNGLQQMEAICVSGLWAQCIVLHVWYGAVRYSSRMVWFMVQYSNTGGFSSVWYGSTYILYVTVKQSSVR
jgi:hypothetical protein